MNAVEIEAAVSELASAPYAAAEFPFQFLAAFDKKETTLKRLRKGDSNKSDVPGAVLLINNIHLATCPAGQTREMLERLKASPKTAAARAKFVFVTDGSYFEAEDVTGAQEPVADFLPNLANHFGFFLPLAGITTVREIKDNPIDVRATGRLNKLYVELLRTNPEWGTAARRHDMNHFMARLIFCYFAEHTDIFNGYRLFTDTIEQMSEGDGSNTHQVVEQIFRAMDVKIGLRATSEVPPYANQFPYVNGGLFRGSAETPGFNRIARSYLLQAGKLEWQHINPDIFGSMIQAVADDEERGALGMHYTSVPNILKVLNPLFLDDLRAQLEAAGDNGRMLLNLRLRMSRIRVFDPACGSGNFLVIAYKRMRSIEAEINRLRGEPMRPTDISKKNFRGIELRDFAAEIARLALVIAEYQCDVQHRGPLAAKAEFLPLDEMNWIVCGNALRLDWLEVCPPEGTQVRVREEGKLQFDTPNVEEINFENEGGETYICGNPPYRGLTTQTLEQKNEMEAILKAKTSRWRSLDYVAGWFMKAAEYALSARSTAAFVATNSICQGEQVPILWPLISSCGQEIIFAHVSLKWTNLASHNAGVTVVIVGIGHTKVPKKLFSVDSNGEVSIRETNHINGYLVPGIETIVSPIGGASDSRAFMLRGNTPTDGGNLLLNFAEADKLKLDPRARPFVRKFIGADELINGRLRYCLWIEDDLVSSARLVPAINERINNVKALRTESRAPSTRASAISSHRFIQIQENARVNSIVVPRVSSERRQYLTPDLLTADFIIGDRNFALYDSDIWNLSVVSSRLHWVWIATVCGRLEMRISYSNTLGWNTFPLPILTEQNKVDLTRCAGDILLAREAHFPATIADLYDPETMPENLRAAHESNDEVLERIYIGRRFRNDTERLEKLFDMYTKMTATPRASAKPAAKRARRANA
jgi:hypothetical protein